MSQATVTESQPSSTGAPTARTITEQTGAGRELSGARILVVDDEPLARQMFTDLLEAQGYSVVTVARGEEAFSVLADVELVLLDAMLPGRDGWSICREIKEQIDPLLPVIMVTARTAPEDVVRTFASGADDYVAKPFHVAELTARIESRLRVHRAEVTIKRTNEQLRQLYEQARRDAEERELLLRELDHRVRNNLSVIMGLLSMERNRKPPRPSEEALRSLESRLRSFMMVHEALRRHNYRGVPIREIAEKLAQRLRNAWGIAALVELAVEGNAENLNEKRGFALALVLNELLTNAFRHGFADGRTGKVTIRIQHMGENLRVEVEDNGMGTAAVTRPELVGSGRSIVAALVNDELGGSVDYHSDEHGTRARLDFPLEA